MIDWRFGRVFEGVCPGSRVIAVRVAGLAVDNEAGNPDGIHWVGPMPLDAANLALLVEWADGVLNAWGGFVHLLPADGDASDRLRVHLGQLGDERRH